MINKDDLLFELGTEELPPKSLISLGRALLENVQNSLLKNGFKFDEARYYITPRRLSFIINDLESAQEDKIIEKRGPSIKAAFKEDGSPSNAALGFAKSCNIAFEELTRIKTEKGEWLASKQLQKGQQLAEILPDIIAKSIKLLPIAKNMRWGSGSAEFVRPVHWAMLLYGTEVIETDILGIKTSNKTYGHRFLSPAAIIINTPEEYENKLFENGKVIVDDEKRKQCIKDGANKKAEEIGGIAFIEESLLEEINALNEWPVPILGQYDKRYLKLPAEVLMTTMQINQKYFPVFNIEKELMPYFLTFSNIASSNPQAIQKGNERVIKPRLADAEFFWDQDRKKTLEQHVTQLENIVFQQKLGNMLDKTQRLVALGEYISADLNTSTDTASIKRACFLSKADLMTEMVSEFPSLQGVMGKYYAIADGETEGVANALLEQYLPKQSGGELPVSTEGQILSISEKIDTLTGIFSASLIPTGDKDPYALRRATLGILRIIIEKELDLDLFDLIKFSLKQYKHEFDLNQTNKLIEDYIFERLKGYCLDNGYEVDEFDSVFSIRPVKPLDFMQRIKAVSLFRELPEANDLSAANKRIRNILKKTETNPGDDFTLLVEPEESQLLEIAKTTSEGLMTYINCREYAEAFRYLSQLNTHVNIFFDNVMVMADDTDLRASRLGLLQLISDQFLKIADISKLQA